MGDPGTTPASYFDSDYFQAGHKKGTRYANYLQEALQSPMYRGMAQAIMAVFRPRRALEIGCAAGAIVKHLNDLGCDAHGIDVSEWAIEHRFHPNVILAGADDLPYEDASFDLVFSNHALEHLPDAIVERSFAEISRVAARHQFHMHPIIGIPPYDGPLELTLANLRSDPTHNQLHERSWWLDGWSRHGWQLVPANILLDADNTFFEFSTCQVVLSRTGDDTQLLQTIQDYNLSFFQRASTWAIRGQGAVSGLSSGTPLSLPDGIELAVTGGGTPLLSRTLSLAGGEWADLIHTFPEPVDLRSGKLYLFCRAATQAPLDLRVAAMTLRPGATSADYGTADVAGVAQFAVTIPPGDSVLELSADGFAPFYGSPRPDRLDVVFFGGETPASATVECVAVLRTPAGLEQLFGAEPCLIPVVKGSTKVVSGTGPRLAG